MDKHELYARTFSATTRHIINPAEEGKTLCGQAVRLPELYMLDDGFPRVAGTSGVYDLPGCRNCDKSSAKLGLIPDRRIRSVKSSELQAYTEDKERAATITVESGTKVTRDGLKGRVLEVTFRAGVMLAAVAFGFEMVWVKVAELVTL